MSVRVGACDTSLSPTKRRSVSLRVRRVASGTRKRRTLGAAFYRSITLSKAARAP